MRQFTIHPIKFRKKKVRKLKTAATDKDGNQITKTIRVRVNKPKKCSAVRRLCLKCKKQIHKNDLNYEKKICKKCDL